VTGSAGNAAQRPRERLWVVVPAYDEEVRLPQTLAALGRQDDTDLTLVVVDNGSRDRTAAVAKDFAATAPFAVEVLVELEKGVGCAVDTGFRHAIAHGATLLARTDADCLPHPDWVSEVRAGFADGAELVCGHIVARRDENGPLGRAAFRGLVVAAALFGRHRAKNRGSDYLVPYQMHAGNNMAITVDLYLRCGGMPRMPAPTDRTFLNRVRRTTTAIQQRRTMVSENSTRRISTYGVVGSARWYLDHGPGQLTPDPR
jgi:glycosyltransferase involved in cell wall biosynthesis